MKRIASIFSIIGVASGSGTRLGLLFPNAALLAIILIGFLFLPASPGGDDGSSITGLLLAAVFLLPLACNVLYLSLRNRSPVGLPHGG